MFKGRLITLFVLVFACALLLTPALAQDTTDRTFSVAVIPDTQYMFDQDRGDSAPLAASLQWIIDNSEARHIVFTAVLGDIVENALVEEFEQADAVYQLFDDAGVEYSLLAGNHDLTNSRQWDNERGDEPYLQYFSPERVADNATYRGATENGYNSYFIFEAAGQEWLLLALDWQASLATLEWAQGVIDEHPMLPVILTTHQLVDDNGAGTGEAMLTEYGSYVWDRLIEDNDQIFLALNGHYWPPARTTMTNAAGNDVHLHLTNYQDRYYGGAAMIRLYEFDLDAGTIAVSTFAPWMQGRPEAERTALDIPELTDATNNFVLHLDFAQRFAGFSGMATAEAMTVPAEDLVVDGTVAYWRFEGAEGEALANDGVAVADLSGSGNDLYRQNLTNSDDSSLVFTAQHHPMQPSAGSIYLAGSYRNPNFGGSFLQTADDAMLNTLTFEDGYTIEAFVRLPDDCCGSQHAWMGVLSRLGTGNDIGQTESDLDEPVTQFAISPGRQYQWAVRTTNRQDILTNWSHEIEPGVWRHVAIVNDGARTMMYVDGAPILRNPRAESIGLATAGQPWTVGAGHYANLVEQSFYGWLGDIRIVDRALTPDEFLTAR